MRKINALKAALAMGLGLSLFLGASSAWSQAYPNRPVQFVTAFPPGSGVDFAARTIAQKLSQDLGQSFVVVNKPGAGGTLASSIVASSPADGYTLLVNSAALTLYPSLYPDAKLDATKDLVSVASLVDTEVVLVTSATRGWHSLGDMLEYAKSKPGSLSFGSSGVGTTTQMSFERLANAAKVTALHVPFKGSPEAVNEVMAGRVDVVYAVIPSTISMIKAGQLVPLSIAGRKRSAMLPEVPTSIEAGIPDSDYSTWTAVFAPSATPKAVLDKLNHDIAVALNTPEVAARLRGAGLVPLPQTREQFQAQLQADFASNAKLAKQVGFRPQ